MVMPSTTSPEIVVNQIPELVFTGPAYSHGCKHFAGSYFYRSLPLIALVTWGFVIMASQAASMAISAMVSSPHPMKYTR